MTEEEGYVSAPLMGIGDAAKYLGVSRKTIYQLIEWGEIRAVRVGRALRVEKRSLDQLKARGTRV